MHDSSPTIWTLEAAVAQMDDWHVGPIRYWLETALAAPGGVSPEELSEVETTNWWNAENLDAGALVGDIVARAAFENPATLAPLVLYIRFAGMLSWELAWEIHPILNVVRATVAAVPGVRAGLPPEILADLDGATALLAFLEDEMLVYPRATAGDLAEWVVASRAAERAAEEALGVARGMTTPCLRDYVVGNLEEEIRYYGAMADAAKAAHSIGRVPGPESERVLAAAVARLRQVEEQCDPIDGSEMRAHRVGLTALLEALETEWLHVVRGRVTIVCPFGITGLPDTEMVERAGAEASEWNLAGLPVVAVRDALPISDIWNTTDPLGRSFRGVAVRLPEIEVHRDDGTVEWSLRPDIWFSVLGNHVLLLELEIEDAGPTELFDALKLSSGDYCNLDLAGRQVTPIAGVGGDEPPSWDSLASFVEAVMDSLTDSLVERSADVLVSYGPGRAVALTLLDQVAARSPLTGQLRTITDVTEVPQLFGSQILSEPLQVSIKSICHWAVFERTHESVIPVQEQGPIWLVRTANSMSVASTAMPSYSLDELRDCFIFAASMQGLFQAWYAELARHNTRLSARLTELTAALEVPGARSLTSARLRAFEAELEMDQVRLQEFLARVRTTGLFIASPTLMMSPVIRELLDRLLEASGYSTQTAQFGESATALTGERVETVLAKYRSRVQDIEEAQRRLKEHRSKLLLEALMTGVAVAGMSGVASLIQTGYDLDALQTAILVALVVIMSLLIGGWVWASSRTMEGVAREVRHAKRARRPRRDSPGDDRAELPAGRAGHG